MSVGNDGSMDEVVNPVPQTNDQRPTDPKVSRPYTRKLRLFTRGEHPALDNLKICWDLLDELPPNERMANLNFIADKLGYRLYDKLRGRFI